MVERAKNTLKRYTSLSVAIDMLMKERITLISPSAWEDKNDIAFLEAYRAKRDIANVFAVCFTQAGETFHHWSVFAPGNEGVRVNIRKSSLLAGLRGSHCYSWGDVDYRTLEQMKEIDKISVYDLPFQKRFAFTDEDEFRILYDCNDPAERSHDIRLERKWITSITLSPWLHPALTDTMKEALKALPGCEDIKVQKTSLRDNGTWQKAIKRVVHETEQRGAHRRQG